LNRDQLGIAGAANRRTAIITREGRALTFSEQMRGGSELAGRPLALTVVNSRGTVLRISDVRKHVLAGGEVRDLTFEFRGQNNQLVTMSASLALRRIFEMDFDAVDALLQRSETRIPSAGSSSQLPCLQGNAEEDLALRGHDHQRSGGRGTTSQSGGYRQGPANDEELL
jgi:hypothetical protein